MVSYALCRELFGIYRTCCRPTGEVQWSLLAGVHLVKRGCGIVQWPPLVTYPSLAFLAIDIGSRLIHAYLTQSTYQNIFESSITKNVARQKFWKLECLLLHFKNHHHLGKCARIPRKDNNFRSSLLTTRNMQC